MKRKAILTLLMLALFSSSALAKDFNGSIKMGWFGSETKAIKEAKITMIQALQSAQASVTGRVIKAKLEEEDGYLVYDIRIVTADGKKFKVYVDPVTAKVLYKDED